MGLSKGVSAQRGSPPRMLAVTPRQAHRCHVCSFKYAPTRLVTHDASTWRSCDYLHLHERSITRIIALYKRCMAVYRRSTERPLGRREVAELRRRDARRVPCSDCRVYPPGFTNRVRRRNPLASPSGFAIVAVVHRCDLMGVVMASRCGM